MITSPSGISVYGDDTRPKAPGLNDLPHDYAWIATWAAKNGTRWDEDWREYVGDAWLRMHHEWETHNGQCGKSFLMTAAKYGVMDSRRELFRSIVSGTNNGHYRRTVAATGVRVETVSLDQGGYDLPVDDPAIEERRVRSTIRTLPARQGQIMALCYDGWDYADASRAMGIRPGTGAQLLHRARARLRRIYRGAA